MRCLQELLIIVRWRWRSVVWLGRAIVEASLIDLRAEPVPAQIRRAVGRVLRESSKQRIAGTQWAHNVMASSRRVVLTDRVGVDGLDGDLLVVLGHVGANTGSAIALGT